MPLSCCLTACSVQLHLAAYVLACQQSGPQSSSQQQPAKPTDQPRPQPSVCGRSPAHFADPVSLDRPTRFVLFPFPVWSAVSRKSFSSPSPFELVVTFCLLSCELLRLYFFFFLACSGSRPACETRCPPSSPLSPSNGLVASLACSDLLISPP